MNSIIVPQTTGNQLPPCVPMNPTTKQKPARKMTERELLVSHAHHIAVSAATEATNCHTFYDLLAYDPETDVVAIRMAMYPQYDPYFVDRRNLTCTCPHFTGAVTKTNNALAAAGLPASLLCKHFLLCDEKLFANPGVLTGLPRTWERVRAESLASAGFGDEFSAKREGDYGL